MPVQRFMVSSFAPLGAGRVADKAATGATTRTERTRRAAVRPSPSEASGLRSVPRAPTMQPQPATRTARAEATDHPTLTDLGPPSRTEHRRVDRRADQPSRGSRRRTRARAQRLDCGVVVRFVDGPVGAMRLYR